MQHLVTFLYGITNNGGNDLHHHFYRQSITSLKCLPCVELQRTVFSILKIKKTLTQNVPATFFLQTVLHNSRVTSNRLGTVRLIILFVNQANSYGRPEYSIFNWVHPNEKNSLKLLDHSGTPGNLWIKRSFDIVNYKPR